LKKFKFSLLYILILLLTLPFHVQIKNLLVNCKGFNFINYVLLAILAVFFALGIYKAFKSGKTLEITAILLATAIVSYFLFQRRIFLNKAFFSNFLHIAEFFILGVLLSKENRKAPTPAALLILFSSAFTFELIQFFFRNRIVDGNDIWINSISGLVGMTAGFF
jgi:exosortase/archaeosortase